MPDQLAESGLEAAHMVIAPEARDGDTFADEVRVPANATAMERLVAFTGRQP